MASVSVPGGAWVGHTEPGPGRSVGRRGCVWCGTREDPECAQALGAVPGEGRWDPGAAQKAEEAVGGAGGGGGVCEGGRVAVPLGPGVFSKEVGSGLWGQGR